MALTQFEVNSIENIKYSLARAAVALEEIAKELKKFNENKSKTLMKNFNKLTILHTN